MSLQMIMPNGMTASQVAELVNRAKSSGAIAVTKESNAYANHIRQASAQAQRIRRTCKKIASGVIIACGLHKATAAELLGRETVAAVIIAEAGGEGRKGMEAVREVIANRAKESGQVEWFVVTKPKQFSCLNSTTTEKLVAKARKHKHWVFACLIASKPPQTNYTKGANHYLAPGRLKKLPSWTAKAKSSVTVGNHTFYKL